MALHSETKMPIKLDELKRRAQRAAHDVDEKYGIRSKLKQGADAAEDAIKSGADAAHSTFDAARREASRLNREHGVSESIKDAAKRTADAARETASESGITEKAEQIVDSAKAKTGDLFGEARHYYEAASGAARAGASAVRLPASVLSAVASARGWVKENPGKAAVVSLAFVAGARAGSAFSSLDLTLLGAGGAGNWLFHSAVVPYGLRKLSEKYESHLKSQEELASDGQLDEASRNRVKFERDVAKYVGAPLLGAFSIAAGAGLVYEAFTGGVVTGVPISLVLGGNPMLSSIWLFGNGLVCFHNGYKFFMMALGDQHDVERVVRDIKALLPEGSA